MQSGYRFVLIVLKMLLTILYLWTEEVKIIPLTFYKRESTFILNKLEYIFDEEDTREMLSSKYIVLKRPYEHDHPGANGRARNVYLDFLKKHFMGEWCLVLDPDEVCDDNFTQFAKDLKEDKHKDFDVAMIKMRHTIGDLAHEDKTITNDKGEPNHFVSNRLFKIAPDLFYPEAEHTVLNAAEKKNWTVIDQFTIWHLSLSKQMFQIKKKYDSDRKKSNTHTPLFLRTWYTHILFGEYPKVAFNPVELPKVIKDHFEIFDDEIYFNNRGLELKHLVDAADWKQYFKPERVLVIGDGLAVRTFALRRYGVMAFGFDISDYAVKNNIGQYGIMDYWQEDLTELPGTTEDHDLVIAYDVLEHIPKEKIDIALNKIKNNCTRWLLVSVPTIGDPNLKADDTHKIKETKEWWLAKIQEHGFKIVPTPQYFLFANQVIIGEK